MKKKARRSFTKEFKIEAVRQVVEQNRPMVAVARELGIGAGRLDHRVLALHRYRNGAGASIRQRGDHGSHLLAHGIAEHLNGKSCVGI